jgi:hypothetical protein
MAEKKPEKKGDKKGDKKAAPSPRPIEIIIAEIIILGGLLFGFIILLGRWFGSEGSNGSEEGEGITISLVSLISSVQVISSFLSLLFIMGIMYAKFKLGQVKRAQKLQSKIKVVEHKKEEKMAASENKKWKRVLEHVSSPNPSDWRLAILEADILLAELLTKMGYRGEGIGEQLKSIEKGELQHINEAWEAHKIRNSIAHEGSNFPLSQREAKRVIALFEEVFKEFYYI